MKRGEFITFLGCVAAAWPLAASAQSKIPRIGFMGNSTAALEANLVDAFREGLREHGYEEGRNIVIEYRWADGKYEQFPALVAELIAAKVDVYRYRRHARGARDEEGRPQPCRSSWLRWAIRLAPVSCQAWRGPGAISLD